MFQIGVYREHYNAKAVLQILVVCFRLSSERNQRKHFADKDMKAVLNQIVTTSHLFG